MAQVFVWRRRKDSIKGKALSPHSPNVLTYVITLFSLKVSGVCVRKQVPASH